MFVVLENLWGFRKSLFCDVICVYSFSGFLGMFVVMLFEGKKYIIFLFILYVISYYVDNDWIVWRFVFSIFRVLEMRYVFFVFLFYWIYWEYESISYVKYLY